MADIPTEAYLSPFSGTKSASALPESSLPFPSPLLSARSKAPTGSKAPAAVSPVPRKSPFKSAIKGSLSDQPAAPAVRIVPGNTLKKMLERAAKARGTPISPPRPSREAADIRPAAAAVSPPFPPVLPAVPPPPVRKQRSSVSTSADLPSGSGSGSCDQDEVIARFVDACPGGSSANMAGLPSEVLVTKGAALLAEVRSIDFCLFLFSIIKKLSAGV